MENGQPTQNNDSTGPQNTQPITSPFPDIAPQQQYSAPQTYQQPAQQQQIPPTPQQSGTPNINNSAYNPYATPQPLGSVGSSKKKTWIIVGATLVVVAGGSFAALKLMGSPKADKGIFVSGDYKVTSSTKYDTTDTTKTTEKTATKQELAINKTVTATDLGYTVQVGKVILNAKNSSQGTDDTTILVEVTSSNTGGKYYGGAASSDFRLVADSVEVIKSTTYDSKRISEENGVIAFDGYPSVNKPVAGYIAFEIPAKTAKILFRYKVPLSKTSDGKSIPAKNYDITIK